jgi:glycosyltransferase involved in cell wall biosynthesis
LLLYIDMAYTLRIVRGRSHEDFWLARHSGGYFPIVWGIHPIADVPDQEVRRRVRVARFARNQISIEGTSQALALPRWLLPVNFLFSQLGLLRALTRHARRRGVRAVFASDPLYCGLFGLALARRLGVPLIVFVPAHYDELFEATGSLGNPRIFGFRKVEQAVMHRVFRHSDMVFAAADSLAQLALKYGAPEQTIARLSHGKYLARDHLTEPASRPAADEALRRYSIPGAANYLIYVGRHNPVKHPEDVLRAMKVVLDAEPEVIGIMAGKGELTGSLQAIAEELAIADRVVFPGLIDQASLSFILPHCVTLSPLTGMALVECSLAGSPVIAYDRDWQSEFVDDRESGRIVPYRDWKAMGEAALDIIRDPAIRKRFGKAGRKKALAFVDIEGNRAKEHAALDAMFERFERREANKGKGR